MTVQNTDGSTSSNEMPAVAGIASPPDATTLVEAPNGYIARPKGSVHERTLMQTQKRAVLDAVAEVRDAVDFTSIFGQIAPDQGDLVNAMAVAGGWSAVIRQVAEWMHYAKDQEKDAWLHALPILDAMQPALTAAVARRPELASRFAALLRYYGIGHARGMSSARARAKAKQAAANDTSKKAPTDGTSAPAAAPPPPPASPTTVAQITVTATPSVVEGHKAA